MLSPPACCPAHGHLQSFPLLYHWHVPATYFSFHIPAFSFLWLYRLFSKTLVGQRKTGSGLAGIKAMLEDTKTVVNSTGVSLRRGREPVPGMWGLYRTGPASNPLNYVLQELVCSLARPQYFLEVGNYRYSGHLIHQIYEAELFSCKHGVFCFRKGLPSPMCVLSIHLSPSGALS